MAQAAFSAVQTTQSHAIKKRPSQGWSFFIGELGRVRTADPLIKSQMLYRLSYEPISIGRSYV